MINKIKKTSEKGINVKKRLQWRKKGKIHKNWPIIFVFLKARMKETLICQSR